MLCLGDQIHGQRIYGGRRMPLLLFKYKCICQYHYYCLSLNVTPSYLKILSSVDFHITFLLFTLLLNRLNCNIYVVHFISNDETWHSHSVFILSLFVGIVLCFVIFDVNFVTNSVHFPFVGTLSFCLLGCKGVKWGHGCKTNTYRAPSSLRMELIFVWCIMELTGIIWYWTF